MFKLFKKKTPTQFITKSVSLGTHRMGYIKPTGTQLAELTKLSMISATPFGEIPKHRSTVTKILDKLGTAPDPNQKQVKYMDFDIADLVKFDQPKDDDSISKLARFK